MLPHLRELTVKTRSFLWPNEAGHKRLGACLRRGKGQNDGAAAAAKPWHASAFFQPFFQVLDMYLCIACAGAKPSTIAPKPR